MCRAACIGHSYRHAQSMRCFDAAVHSSLAEHLLEMWMLLEERVAKFKIYTAPFWSELNLLIYNTFRDSPLHLTTLTSLICLAALQNPSSHLDKPSLVLSGDMLFEATSVLQDSRCREAAPGTSSQSRGPTPLFCDHGCWSKRHGLAQAQIAYKREML